jgi:hypothetical protein
MKTSRLLVYGAAGIIAGLLIENRVLILKGRLRTLQKKLNKKTA